MLDPLPASFAATRAALHTLAEHVIAPARYRVDGHIWLVPTPGGFGTPVFGDGERVRVDGVELVHERPGSTRRVAIRTLADAAQFLEIPLGAPTDVYKPATAAAPDTPLEIDVDAARTLAAWTDFAGGLLDELRHAYAAHDATAVKMWPEHFDVACDFGDAGAGTRANYGASPGDGAIAEPYLYVGPWDPDRRTGAFAMCPFGAAITYHELQASSDSKDAGRRFFGDGAALLLGAP
jgi:hypothetical protein